MSKKIESSKTVVKSFFLGLLLTGLATGCGSSSSSDSDNGARYADNAQEPSTEQAAVPFTPAADDLANYSLEDVGFTVDTATPGLTVVDRTSHEVLRRLIFSGTSNIGVGFNHFANITEDGKLWICRNTSGSATDASVDIYDVKNLSLLKRWEVGCGIQNTWSRDGKWIFTAKAQEPRGVNVFDVDQEKHLGFIEIGQAPHVGDALGGDNTIYWTTDAAGGNLLGFDISKLSEGLVPLDPTHSLNIGGNLHALRAHPNGKYVFVGRAAGGESAGTYIVDTATVSVVKHIPGVPHNYALSPDGNYLVSTELNTADAALLAQGFGNRLQIIDISELDRETPVLADIQEVYDVKVSGGFGGSHASWNPNNDNELWFTLYHNTGGEGLLLILDTANLPTAVTPIEQLPVGLNPHSPIFAGKTAD